MSMKRNVLVYGRVKEHTYAPYPVTRSLYCYASVHHARECAERGAVQRVCTSPVTRLGSPSPFLLAQSHRPHHEFVHAHRDCRAPGRTGHVSRSVTGVHRLRLATNISHMATCTSCSSNCSAIRAMVCGVHDMAAQDGTAPTQMRAASKRSRFRRGSSRRSGDDSSATREPPLCATTHTTTPTRNADGQDTCRTAMDTVSASSSTTSVTTSTTGGGHSSGRNHPEDRSRDETPVHVRDVSSFPPHTWDKESSQTNRATANTATPSPALGTHAYRRAPVTEHPPRAASTPTDLPSPSLPFKHAEACGVTLLRVHHSMRKNYLALQQNERVLQSFCELLGRTVCETDNLLTDVWGGVREGTRSDDCQMHLHIDTTHAARSVAGTAHTNAARAQQTSPSSSSSSRTSTQGTSSSLVIAVPRATLASMQAGQWVGDMIPASRTHNHSRAVCDVCFTGQSACPPTQSCAPATLAMSASDRARAELCARLWFEAAGRQACVLHADPARALHTALGLPELQSVQITTAAAQCRLAESSGVAGAIAAQDGGHEDVVVLMLPSRRSVEAVLQLAQTVELFKWVKDESCLLHRRESTFARTLRELRGYLTKRIDGPSGMNAEEEEEEEEEEEGRSAAGGDRRRSSHAGGEWAPHRRVWRIERAQQAMAVLQRGVPRVDDVIVAGGAGNGAEASPDSRQHDARGSGDAVLSCGVRDTYTVSQSSPWADGGGCTGNDVPHAGRANTEHTTRVPLESNAAVTGDGGAKTTQASATTAHGIVDPSVARVHVLDLMMHLLMRYLLCYWPLLSAARDRTAVLRLACLPWYRVPGGADCTDDGAAVTCASSAWQTEEEKDIALCMARWFTHVERHVMRIDSHEANVTHMAESHRVDRDTNACDTGCSTPHRSQNTCAVDGAIGAPEACARRMDSLYRDCLCVVRAMRLFFWPSPLDTDSPLVQRVLQLDNTRPAAAATPPPLSELPSILTLLHGSSRRRRVGELCLRAYLTEFARMRAAAVGRDAKSRTLPPLSPSCVWTVERICLYVMDMDRCVANRRRRQTHVDERDTSHHHDGHRHHHNNRRAPEAYGTVQLGQSISPSENTVGTSRSCTPCNDEEAPACARQTGPTCTRVHGADALTPRVGYDLTRCMLACVAPPLHWLSSDDGHTLSAPNLPTAPPHTGLRGRQGMMWDGVFRATASLCCTAAGLFVSPDDDHGNIAPPRRALRWSSYSCVFPASYFVTAARRGRDCAWPRAPAARRQDEMDVGAAWRSLRPVRLWLQCTRSARLSLMYALLCELERVRTRWENRITTTSAAASSDRKIRGTTDHNDDNNNKNNNNTSNRSEPTRMHDGVRDCVTMSEVHQACDHLVRLSCFAAWICAMDETEEATMRACLRPPLLTAASALDSLCRIVAVSATCTDDAKEDGNMPDSNTHHRHGDVFVVHTRASDKAGEAGQTMQSAAGGELWGPSSPEESDGMSGPVVLEPATGGAAMPSKEEEEEEVTLWWRFCRCLHMDLGIAEWGVSWGRVTTSTLACPSSAEKGAAAAASSHPIYPAKTTSSRASPDSAMVSQTTTTQTAASRNEVAFLRLWHTWNKADAGECAMLPSAREMYTHLTALAERRADAACALLSAAELSVVLRALARAHLRNMSKLNYRTRNTERDTDNGTSCRGGSSSDASRRGSDPEEKEDEEMGTRSLSNDGVSGTDIFTALIAAAPHVSQPEGAQVATARVERLRHVLLVSVTEQLRRWDSDDAQAARATTASHPAAMWLDARLLHLISFAELASRVTRSSSLRRAVRRDVHMHHVVLHVILRHHRALASLRLVERAAMHALLHAAVTAECAAAMVQARAVAQQAGRATSDPVWEGVTESFCQRAAMGDSRATQMSKYSSIIHRSSSVSSSCCATTTTTTTTTTTNHNNSGSSSSSITTDSSASNLAQDESCAHTTDSTVCLMNRHAWTASSQPMQDTSLHAHPLAAPGVDTRMASSRSSVSSHPMHHRRPHRYHPLSWLTQRVCVVALYLLIVANPSTERWIVTAEHSPAVPWRECYTVLLHLLSMSPPASWGRCEELVILIGTAAMLTVQQRWSREQHVSACARECRREMSACNTMDATVRESRVAGQRLWEGSNVWTARVPPPPTVPVCVCLLSFASCGCDGVSTAQRSTDSSNSNTNHTAPHNTEHTCGRWDRHDDHRTSSDTKVTEDTKDAMTLLQRWTTSLVTRWLHRARQQRCGATEGEEELCESVLVGITRGEWKSLCWGSVQCALRRMAGCHEENNACIARLLYPLRSVGHPFGLERPSTLSLSSSASSSAAPAHSYSHLCNRVGGHSYRCCGNSEQDMNDETSCYDGIFCKQDYGLLFFMSTAHTVAQQTWFSQMLNRYRARVDSLSLSEVHGVLWVLQSHMRSDKRNGTESVAVTGAFRHVDWCMAGERIGENGRASLPERCLVPPHGNKDESLDDRRVEDATTTTATTITAAREPSHAVASPRSERVDTNDSRGNSRCISSNMSHETSRNTKPSTDADMGKKDDIGHSSDSTSSTDRNNNGWYIVDSNSNSEDAGIPSRIGETVHGVMPGARRTPNRLIGGARTVTVTNLRINRKRRLLWRDCARRILCTCDDGAMGSSGSKGTIHYPLHHECLITALTCGVAVGCADTVVFEQVLACLLCGPFIPRWTLYGWVAVAGACEGMTASTRAQAISLLCAPLCARLRWWVHHPLCANDENFAEASFNCGDAKDSRLDCDEARKEVSERSASNDVHVDSVPELPLRQVCTEWVLLMESMAGLFVAQAELWCLVRAVVEAWCGAVWKHMPREEAMFWCREWECSYAWALRTSGHAWMLDPSQNGTV